MGNCGNCPGTCGPQQQEILTKQDRIDNFEKALPFKALFIDEFECLILAAARIEKFNNEYSPPLKS